MADGSELQYWYLARRLDKFLDLSLSWVRTKSSQNLSNLGDLQIDENNYSSLTTLKLNVWMYPVYQQLPGAVYLAWYIILHPVLVSYTNFIHVEVEKLI